MSSKHVTYPECQSCSHRNHSVFCELEQSIVAYMDQHRHSKHYQNGQLLFYEGNDPSGLFCLNSGKVKLYKSGEDGKQTIVRIVLPGDLLGHRSLFSNQSYAATAEVIEDAVICFLPKDIIQQALERNPTLSIKIVEYLSSSLGIAENHLRDFAQKSVLQRVIEFLISLHASHTDNGEPLRIPLSREEIAELLGTTPESTTRTLSKLKQDKLIALKGREFRILDMNKLLNLAGLED